MLAGRKKRFKPVTEAVKLKPFAVYECIYCNISSLNEKAKDNCPSFTWHRWKIVNEDNQSAERAVE